MASARATPALHPHTQRVRGVVRVVSAIATLMALSACPPDPRTAAASHVIAKVGDVGVQQAQVLAALAQRGTARIADPNARSAVARAIIDSLVEDELLLQGAKKASISVSDDDVEREVRANAEGYPAGTFARMLVAEQLTLEAYRERVRRRLVEESFLRARLAQLPPLTDEEVRARYESTVSKVERPEAVHVRQVLLHTREEASHLLEQIRKKTLSVEVAARKFSAAPEADTGGDLGWFARGELPDAFDECFALDPGTISDVVESKYGFHIFQILERRDAGVEPFESARERIEADLARERQTQLVDTLLVELRRELPVVVNEAALDRVVALLPPATSMPVAPHNETDENSEARALDAHIQSNETLREAPHTGATHRRAETHE